MDIYGLREYILSYLNYKELCDIRLINGYYNEAVRKVNVNDIITDIYDPEIWYKNFPNSIGIKINNDWYAEDFKFLKKIQILSIVNCNSTNVDKSFKYLKKLHTLYLKHCNNITDEVFKYLSNIHTLNMMCCDNITDEAFKYLKRINDLRIDDCSNVTNKIFEYLTFDWKVISYKRNILIRQNPKRIHKVLIYNNNIDKSLKNIRGIDILKIKQNRHYDMYPIDLGREIISEFFSYCFTSKRKKTKNNIN